jgi:hypothetical protein
MIYSGQRKCNRANGDGLFSRDTPHFPQFGTPGKQRQFMKRVTPGEPTPKLTFRNNLHSHRFAEENSGVELKSNAIDLCYNSHNRDRLI